MVRRVVRVISGRSVVRHHIGDIRVNLYGWGQGGLLPANGRLIGEGDTGQETASAGPQVAHMRAGVPLAFVKPDARDVAMDTRLEFQPELNRVGVRGCWHGGGG